RNQPSANARNGDAELSTRFVLVAELAMVDSAEFSFSYDERPFSAHVLSWRRINCEVHHAGRSLQRYWRTLEPCKAIGPADAQRPLGNGPPPISCRRLPPL